MAYVNAHGQEPSPPEDPNAPDPHAAHRGRMWNRYVEQAGHLPIDLNRCQAPTVTNNAHPRWRGQCENPADFVMVENNPGPDGRIAGMALCVHCKDRALLSHGPAYALFTPIVPGTAPAKG